MSRSEPTRERADLPYWTCCSSGFTSMSDEAQAMYCLLRYALDDNGIFWGGGWPVWSFVGGSEEALLELVSNGFAIVQEDGLTGPTWVMLGDFRGIPVDELREMADRLLEMVASECASCGMEDECPSSGSEYCASYCEAGNV